MKNFKWGTESFNDKPIHVVLFKSRNKDNQGIEGFKERRMSFITHKSIDELTTKFEDFVRQGVIGEMSRMYYSVNARDPKKIYTTLMHFLFDTPDFNLCSIEPKLAGIAAQKECAAEKKWMFDFDIPDFGQVIQFEEDIKRIADDSNNPITVEIHHTPHGFAVITSRGFDTRPLYKIWDPALVGLKRDDLLCCNWMMKTKETITGSDS